MSGALTIIRGCKTCPTQHCVPIEGASDGGVNPGVIAGPIIGAFLVVASVLLFWWLRRKKVRKGWVFIAFPPARPEIQTCCIRRRTALSRPSRACRPSFIAKVPRLTPSTEARPRSSGGPRRTRAQGRVVGVPHRDRIVWTIIAHHLDAPAVGTHEPDLRRRSRPSWRCSRSWQQRP